MTLSRVPNIVKAKQCFLVSLPGGTKQSCDPCAGWEAKAGETR